MLPSESVISCVNVYGLRGRRRSVACRHCVQMKVVFGWKVLVPDSVVRRGVVIDILLGCFGNWV